MHRRALLKSMALAGLALPASTTHAAARVSRALVPVDASWERVLSTVVGLRPFRPSGFVVRAERIDGKTVVHNYGHGGAGMSLAWGTSALAADLALTGDGARAAVLGCGVAGLTAARQLQRRGFTVTVYAADIPPRTTSNMSMATFMPATGIAEPRACTTAWASQFREAAELSYRELTALVGPRYGVSWTDNYHATDDPHGALTRHQHDDARIAMLLPPYLRADYGRELLHAGDHPFPTRFAIRTSVLSIEPDVYLEALMQDVTAAGGRISLRRFDTIRDVMALDEPVVVNATGLGSHALVGDPGLIPVKGQLTLLAPQPEVSYRASARLKGGIIVGMHPRRDGIVLGNMQQKGNWSLAPDEAVRKWMIDGAIAFFSAMQRRSVS